LFLDEAYALTRLPTSAHYEVIDTLVKAMEDNQNRFVLVCAGYPAEMQQFISTNPGFRSRFADPLFFTDLSVNELGNILLRLARSEGFILATETLHLALKKLMLIQSSAPQQFGNARTVAKLFDRMKKHLAERVMLGLKRTGSSSLERVPYWNEFIPSDLNEDGVEVIISATPIELSEQVSQPMANWVVRNARS
jgi:hypothetical protein